MDKLSKMRKEYEESTAALPQSYWTAIEQEDEVHGFVCAVDQSLNDCIKLLQQVTLCCFCDFEEFSSKVTACIQDS